ncbi:hypothetical protein [Alkalihalophilus marmarensis]|uniref:hypothetical protein n=1 Tax=Alkalihalophilus marmarensis TaxID=521377 RepID=UPI002DBAF570|nr:hypothetical protein [Alkalihalophilus marmarensis]MEC2073993.1 hypothetical protein [Alkalihalophilus marmarensis]
MKKSLEVKGLTMITIEEYKNRLLEHFNDMEKLELIIFDRTAELLLYRSFIKEKGLETELKQRIEQAKALADVQLFK